MGLPWEEQLIQCALHGNQGVFVTATDTDAGKTWVSTRALLALRHNGYKVQARKPIESGWGQLTLGNSDTGQLAHAAGIPPEQVCHYRLQAALSPPRAALLENKHITLTDLQQSCLMGVHEGKFLLVEGAGGFYSPIASDGLNADLAQRLGLPLLLVAPDRVGCLNHLLLTLEAAQRRHIAIAAIILNRRYPAPAGMDNAADLRQLTAIPIIETHPSNAG